MQISFARGRYRVLSLPMSVHLLPVYAPHAQQSLLRKPNDHIFNHVIAMSQPDPMG